MSNHREKELFFSHILDWCGKLKTPVFLIVLLVVMIGVGIIFWHIQKPTENGSDDFGTLPEPIASTQEKEKRKARDQAAELVKQADEDIQVGNLDKTENLLNEVMYLDDTAQGLTKVQQKLVDARQAEIHQKEQLEIQRRKENAKREKIDQLLVSARKNIEANRLVLPASNNAFKDYQAILVIDPSNSKAKSGIKAIAERYIGMARDAIDSSYFSKAEQMLSNAEIADAGAPDIRILREKISSKKENAITQFDNAFRLIEKGDYAAAEQIINQVVRINNAEPIMPEVRDNLESTRQAATRRTATTRSIGKVFQDELKVGGLGPKMVVLPAGDFMMGSTKESDGDERDDDERQHRITIDKPFAIGQYEVTNAEYRRFRPDHDSGKYSGLNLNGDDQPVVRLSWHDAVAYAKWLSKQTGKTYRLPTEAEWEYAARAKTTARRYWGDDPGQAGAYANVYDQTAKSMFNFNWSHHASDDSYAVTSPVGRFKPNEFKLYDMLGNAWEWTCSEYDRNFGGGEKRCISAGDALRALRGGSWSNAPSFVRSARRSGTRPSDRHSTDGFRLAQDI